MIYLPMNLQHISMCCVGDLLNHILNENIKTSHLISV